ncbi:hypothetical protein O181_082920 [Austropuccinia psidii MF-1]|uniref:Uncharacterized protein n=1 Tax=Austropuccinia psidii MF-1 TaxID=1389203 RepID=A0A9Q3IL94_9BASI|nr:hypothetical protein [Austropuccinia psidii MF-1]
MNSNSAAASSLHTLNLLCHRAERDIKNLEEEYQAWVRRREERRQHLLVQLKKIQSSSRKTQFCSSNTMISIQAELDKMRDEDNEKAYRELLERQDSLRQDSLPYRKPAYKKLAFEIALEKNREALREATAQRDALLNQRKGKGKEKATPAEGEEDDNDGVPRAGPSRPSAGPSRAQPQRFFSSRLDAAMAKGTTRKFGMNYPIVHDEFVTDGWKKNWGLHDVRAC